VTDVLASAVAVLRENTERTTTVHIGGQHYVADLAPYPTGRAAGATPLGLLLGGLASDVAITVRAYTNRRYTYPGEVEVHACFLAAADDGECPEVWLRVVTSRALDDHENDALHDLVNRTPLNRLLRRSINIHAEFLEKT
jgi:uncharacterized OsmC-like protein